MELIFVEAEDTLISLTKAPSPVTQTISIESPADSNEHLVQSEWDDEASDEEDDDSFVTAKTSSIETTNVEPTLGHLDAPIQKHEAEVCTSESSCTCPASSNNELYCSLILRQPARLEHVQVEQEHEPDLKNGNIEYSGQATVFNRAPVVPWNKLKQGHEVLMNEQSHNTSMQARTFELPSLDSLLPHRPQRATVLLQLRNQFDLNVLPAITSALLPLRTSPPPPAETTAPDLSAVTGPPAAAEPSPIPGPSTLASASDPRRNSVLTNDSFPLFSRHRPDAQYYYRTPSSVLSPNDILTCKELEVLSKGIKQFKYPLTFTVQRILFETAHSIYLLAADSFGFPFVLKSYALAKRNSNPVRKELIVQASAYLDCVDEIVNVHATFVDHAYLFLVLDPMPGTTLHDLIHGDGVHGGLHNARAGDLEPRVLRLTRDLIQAVRQCHDLGVVHRGIEPRSLFITRSGGLRLGDFQHCHRSRRSLVNVANLAVNHYGDDLYENLTGAESRPHTTRSVPLRRGSCFGLKRGILSVATLPNRTRIDECDHDDMPLQHGVRIRDRLARPPPDLRMANPKLDMWCVGLVVYEMIFRTLPPAQAKCVTFPQSPKISDCAKDFVLKLLHRNPLRRISAKQAMSHRWLTDEHYAEGNRKEERSESVGMVHAADVDLDCGMEDGLFD